jgi:tripartite-type tricarboxylate transporter receptor subunit TctC
MNRRSLIARCIAGAVLTASAGLAVAQDWPTRHVRMVVPFPAGSTPDLLARVLSERLAIRLGQPFVVENRAGAAGNIGTDAVAKAAPDGYTIGISIAGPLAINPLLFQRMPYDPAKDIKLVTIAATQPTVLVASSKLAVNDAKAFFARLAQKDTHLSFSTMGAGTISQMGMYVLTANSASNVLHIPYNGSGAAALGVITGEVDSALLPAAAVVPQIQAGKMKGLAVADTRRLPALPDLPTLAESGAPPITADAWMGVIAPSGTPDAITERLHKELVAILAEPAVQDRLAAQYMSAVANTPAEFRQVLDKEVQQWQPVIRRHNITIQ